MTLQNTEAATALAHEIAARQAGLPDRRTATIRNLRCESSKRLKTAEPQTVINIALALLDVSPFVAYELVHVSERGRGWRRAAGRLPAHRRNPVCQTGKRSGTRQPQGGRSFERMA